MREWSLWLGFVGTRTMLLISGVAAICAFIVFEERDIGYLLAGIMSLFFYVSLAHLVVRRER